MLSLFQSEQNLSGFAAKGGTISVCPFSLYLLMLDIPVNEGGKG